MNDVLHRIIEVFERDPGPVIAVIAITFGCGIAAISTIAGVAGGVSRRKQVESSRREVAAYIAEGSMTVEEGERLMNAGPRLPGIKNT
ncbi:MAG: hypothetical protein AAGD00_06930 [Planctomycetota bacterium]